MKLAVEQQVDAVLWLQHVDANTAIKILKELFNDAEKFRELINNPGIIKKLFINANFEVGAAINNSPLFDSENWPDKPQTRHNLSEMFRAHYGVDYLLNNPLEFQNETIRNLASVVDPICNHPNELLRLLNAKNFLMDNIGILSRLISLSTGNATEMLLEHFDEIKKTQHWQKLNPYVQQELEKQLRDHKMVNEILDAASPAEMRLLLNEYKDKITDTTELNRLISFAKKDLTKAIIESKMLESLTIDYTNRVELQRKLYNHYNTVSGEELSLSNTQMETLEKLKINTGINDGFLKFNNLIGVLEKNRPDLGSLLLLYYHPDKFPSDLEDQYHFSKVVHDYAEKIAEISSKKLTEATFLSIIRQAHHIESAEMAIKFDFNIYNNKSNEPRYTAEDAAIKLFLKDHPDKNSDDYRLIQLADNSARMLFHYARAVNELQDLKRKHIPFDPETLSNLEREKLVNILNRVENSAREMEHNQTEMRNIIRRLSLTATPIAATERASVTVSASGNIGESGRLSPATKSAAASPPPKPANLEEPRLRAVTYQVQAVSKGIHEAIDSKDREALTQIIAQVEKSGNKEQLEAAKGSLLKKRMELIQVNLRNGSKDPDGSRAAMLQLITEMITKMQSLKSSSHTVATTSHPSPKI